MHKGIFEGKEVFYIITDGSDEEYAKKLLKNKIGKLNLHLLIKTPEDAFNKSLSSKMVLKEMEFMDSKMKYFQVLLHKNQNIVH